MKNVMSGGIRIESYPDNTAGTDRAEPLRETDRGNFGTPYDDAFKTLLETCTRLIIPVVNEAFGEHYTGNERIERSSGEFHIRMNNGEVRKVEGDSFFTILSNVPKRYHIECQSTPDATMLVRMLEYDIQDAIAGAELADLDADHDTDLADLDADHGVMIPLLTIRLPNSAVLYLRSRADTPEHSVIRIETPDGSVSYRVRNIKAGMYSADELFDRNLLFLLPFHIFNFERDFDKIEAEKDLYTGLCEHYAEICSRLTALAEENTISEYEKQAILEMMGRVIAAIAHKYDNVRKVGRSMGGVVLDFEAKRIHDQSIKLGLEQGLEQGGIAKAVKVVDKLVAAEGYTIEEACSIAEISVEDYEAAK